MNSPGPCEDTDSLTITVTPREGVIVSELRGEVDLGNHEQLRAAVALLSLEQRARAIGHGTTAIGASPSISKVIGLLGQAPMSDISPGRR